MNVGVQSGFGTGDRRLRRLRTEGSGPLLGVDRSLPGRELTTLRVDAGPDGAYSDKTRSHLVASAGRRILAEGGASCPP